MIDAATLTVAAFIGAIFVWAVALVGCLIIAFWPVVWRGAVRRMHDYRVRRYARLRRLAARLRRSGLPTDRQIWLLAAGALAVAYWLVGPVEALAAGLPILVRPKLTTTGEPTGWRLVRLKDGITIDDARLRLQHHDIRACRKPPSLRALERYTSDGVCPTPDGCRVEPDGECRHGLPAWLALLGYV